MVIVGIGWIIIIRISLSSEIRTIKIPLGRIVLSSMSIVTPVKGWAGPVTPGRCFILCTKSHGSACIQKEHNIGLQHETFLKTKGNIFGHRHKDGFPCCFSKRYKNKHRKNEKRYEYCTALFYANDLTFSVIPEMIFFSHINPSGQGSVSI